VRFYGRSRPVLIAALAALFSACATTDPAPRTYVGEGSPILASETGGCKPVFISPHRDDPENVPRHSCWNRLWEVPAALVVVPLAIGVLVGAATAPIWVPILLIP
jgi:hypothetical protein